MKVKRGYLNRIQKAFQLTFRAKISRNVKIRRIRVRTGIKDCDEFGIVTYIHTSLFSSLPIGVFQ
jgi:predicted transcriptional regulator